MRFCIPIAIGSEGGRHTFLSNFLTYLEKLGVSVTDDIESDYDILFVNSWVVPYASVYGAKARKTHTRVVHRIDGSALDYGRTDGADARQARVNLLADLTIFQSQYGKYATTQKFKVISHDGPVIYNPVDTKSFSPDGPRMDLAGRCKVCHVTFSTNPHKGVQSLYTLAKSNPDIDFILVGQYKDPPLINNVRLLGVLNRETLPKALRACDVYLTFSENEACPNTVLEALATGLPILYKDSGAVAELVGPCGLAAEVANFRDRLEEALRRRKELSLAARVRAETLFAPDVIFPKYLEAIRKTDRRPLPSIRDLIKLRFQGYPVMFPFSGMMRVYSKS